MKQLMRTLAIAAAVVGIASSARAGAVTPALTLDIPSSYVWRGITFNNRVVAQPSATLSMAGTKGTFVAGVWASVEPGASGTAIAQRGFDNPGLGEADFTLEYGRALPAGSLALGAVAYTFHGTDVSSGFNTAELYGRFALAAPLAPTAAVYYDVDAIRGAYVELGVSHTVPIATQKVSFGVNAGLCAGQSLNADHPEELANFVEDGLTHVDVSARTTFASGPFTFSPVLHVILNGDDITRRTSLDPDDQDRSTKYWVGLSAGWTR